MCAERPITFNYQWEGSQMNSYTMLHIEAGVFTQYNHNKHHWLIILWFFNIKFIVNIAILWHLWWRHCTVTRWSMFFTCSPALRFGRSVYDQCMLHMTCASSVRNADFSIHIDAEYLKQFQWSFTATWIHDISRTASWLTWENWSKEWDFILTTVIFLCNFFHVVSNIHIF